MKMKTLLAALALTVAPGFALAYSCNFDRIDTASMTCAEGSAWDAATQTCVPVASS